MKSAALSPVIRINFRKCIERKKKEKEERRNRTDHDRRRVCVAGCHFRHDTRIGHPHPSYPSNTQLIVNHGERIIRRSHLAGSRLMILRRSVMTDRAFPISVAAEFQMLAILYRSSIQLETVSEKVFCRNCDIKKLLIYIYIKNIYVCTLCLNYIYL